MRKAARGLARLGVTFDVMLTSPLVRTRQTAEIVAGGFDPRPPIVTVDSLAPGGTYRRRARRSREARAPHAHRAGRPRAELGELAARLVGSRHPIEFKKGAVCRIDVEDAAAGRPGDLRWLLTTKILRRAEKVVALRLTRAASPACQFFTRILISLPSSDLPAEHSRTSSGSSASLAKRSATSCVASASRCSAAGPAAARRAGAAASRGGSRDPAPSGSASATRTPPSAARRRRAPANA